MCVRMSILQYARVGYTPFDRRPFDRSPFDRRPFDRKKVYSTEDQSTEDHSTEDHSTEKKSIRPKTIRPKKSPFDRKFLENRCFRPFAVRICLRCLRRVFAPTQDLFRTVEKTQKFQPEVELSLDL